MLTSSKSGIISRLVGTGSATNRLLIANFLSIKPLIVTFGQSVPQVPNTFSGKCSDSTMIGGCGKFENIKVPEDHFLVLGDNRSNSWDGRYWPGSKFLHKKEIIGKAYFRFWPLSQVGFFNK